MLEDEEEEEEESSEESADEPLDEEDALDDFNLRDFVEEDGDGEADLPGLGSQDLVEEAGGGEDGPLDDAAVASPTFLSDDLGSVDWPGLMVEGASCKARSGVRSSKQSFFWERAASSSCAAPRFALRRLAMRRSVATCDQVPRRMPDAKPNCFCTRRIACVNASRVMGFLLG